MTRIRANDRNSAAPGFRLKTLLIAIAIASVSLAVGIEVWQRANSHVVPEEALWKLRIGMSQSEVLQLLGDPTAIDELGPTSSLPAKSTEWTYREFLCPQRLVLRFDANDKLTYCDDDNGMASVIWWMKHKMPAYRHSE